MLKYFNIDDYMALDVETRKLVDDWLDGHDLLEAGITFVQQTDDGQVIAAGFNLDAAGHAVDDDIVVKCMVDDDFPWEIIEKNLIHVGNSDTER